MKTVKLKNILRGVFVCILMSVSIYANSTTLMSEDFESGMNGWSTYVDASATGGSVLQGDNGSTRLFGWTTNMGSESWHLHFRKDGIAIQQGKKYTVSFDARCETGFSRPIAMKIEQGYAPYTNYSNAPDFMVTDQYQTFTYSFVMESATDSWAGICFEYGLFDGMSDPIDIYVDNITIEESDAAVEPVVTILSPTNNFLTNSTPVTVEWSVDGIVQTTELSADLVEGSNEIVRSFTNGAGLTGSDAVAVILDTEAPVVVISSPIDGTELTTPEVAVVWSVDGVVQNSELIETLVEGANTITRTVTDAAGNVGTSAVTVHYIVDSNLPPDPVTVAPILDSTQSTSLAEATEFLYTGDNPIQTGVVDGTIEAKRVAILKGQVKDISGAPLTGVTITVHQHNEFGETKSRADGNFDMAVNGGGSLVINYEKEGYFSAQRRVDTPWRDYVFAPDVILIQADANVTPVELSPTSPMQVARGSVVTDDDGVRQATVIFPAGTQSTDVPLSTINVRATEYSVGENGPEAMPATMPSQIAYTYCTELSVDGVDNITFDRPVFVYLENFLNFPVGGAVPAGYYDREKAVWVPSQNGRIIEILSEVDGKAVVDIDGSGSEGHADSLVVLGITDEEREQLATMYEPGQTLWRVPVTHFTPWDFNWPYGPPEEEEGAVEAPRISANEIITDETPLLSSYTGGSLINVAHQILHESVPVAGAPFSVNYASDRVPGRTVASEITIPLTDNTVPTEVKKVELKISIAGREITQSFNPAPNLGYTFTWDGTDCYGREIVGMENVEIAVGYTYDAEYQEPGEFGESFGEFSGIPISGNEARQEITLWSELEVSISSPIKIKSTLGRWDVSLNHFYSASTQTLFMGNGSQRNATNLAHNIEVVAGSRYSGFSGDGGLATEARLDMPEYLTFGNDGSLFISDNRNNRVRKISPDGIITTIAGNGQDGYQGSYSGDGGLATEALIHEPKGLSVSEDGSVYIVDEHHHSVRKVSPDGIITTVAGTGERGTSNDGDIAIEANLDTPRNVIVKADGTIFIADKNNYSIRKVSRNGVISSFVGERNGERKFAMEDGIPANEAYIALPDRMCFGPDGSFYLTYRSKNLIRKISPSGIIRTIAGSGNLGYNGDGNLATVAELARPQGIACASDGTLYIADILNRCIRRVSPDGIITTIAIVPGAIGLAVSPDDVLYCVAWHQVLKITPALPESNGIFYQIPSEDGSQIFHFNANGKHLKTINALTGSTIYEFTYNAEGLLETVTDGDNNITTINRSGSSITITAPFGQVTDIRLNADGYIRQVTNPANERVQMSYHEGGLLERITDARDNDATFLYDAKGRLTKRTNARGGYTELVRSAEQDSTYLVTLTKSKELGRTYTSTHTITKHNSGDVSLTIVDQGDSTVVTHHADGSRTNRAADGTITTSKVGPDPRFNMTAPIVVEETVKLPSGKTLTTTRTRTTDLADESDIFSYTEIVDEVTVDGVTTVSRYEKSTGKTIATSPLGKSTVSIIDEKGRIIKDSTDGIEPVSYLYDDKGRLTTTTTGVGADKREAVLTYNSDGFVERSRNAINQEVSSDYDAVGRVLRTTLPNAKEVAYDYDKNGNLTEITPPEKPVHLLTYDELNSLKNYDAPMVNGASNRTTHTYNLMNQITRTTRPDGDVISYVYDNKGRLSQTNYGMEHQTYTYHDGTNKIETISSGTGTISYTYDGALLTGVTTTGPAAGTITITHNDRMEVVSQQVNSTPATAFIYDDDGLLATAGAMTVHHDVRNGRLTGTTLGALSDTILYNHFGELELYRVKQGGSDIFTEQITSVDKLGRIQAKTETVNGEVSTYGYVYDEVGQLITVTKDGADYANYTYGSNGNRLNYSGSRGVADGVFDAQDRMISYGENSYEYNDNGEILSKTNGAGTTSYHYDELGNLRSVTLPDATLIEYVVDAQNRRIGKKVGGSLVQGFVYSDQLNPVAELDALGEVVSRFVYASKSHVPDYMEKGGVTYRIISDHLGSVRMVIEPNTGEILQELEYDEFGFVLKNTNPGFQPFGFAGGIMDNHTGLVNYGARDYDAEIGRWISKDPIRFDGGDVNLYRYCGNDPVNSIDPTGLAEYVAMILPLVVNQNSTLYNTIEEEHGGMLGYYRRIVGTLENLRHVDVDAKHLWIINHGADNSNSIKLDDGTWLNPEQLYQLLGPRMKKGLQVHIIACMQRSDQYCESWEELGFDITDAGIGTVSTTEALERFKETLSATVLAEW